MLSGHGSGVPVSVAAGGGTMAHQLQGGVQDGGARGPQRLHGVAGGARPSSPGWHRNPGYDGGIPGTPNVTPTPMGGGIG